MKLNIPQPPRPLAPTLAATLVILGTQLPSGVVLLPTLGDAAAPTLASAPAVTTLDSGPPSRIIIPALGLNSAVINAPRTDISWEVDHLGWRVGHLEGTPYPGQGSNVVLGAHSYLGVNSGYIQPGPWVGLYLIQPGDSIQVYAGGSVYTYTVTQQFRVAPTDVWVTQPTNEETLTLLTCDTWDPVSHTFKQRLVVRARLTGVR